MANWYPENKKELEDILDKFLQSDLRENKKINGIIVPHAGYIFSGAIAGKAFSLLKNKKTERAIILSPSHYIPVHGILTSNKDYWETPLGKIKISKEFDFKEFSVEKEHAIDNQVPFLQKLGFKEIIPLLVGEITNKEAEKIAEKIKNFDGIFIFSTDLSHFFPYDLAVFKDKQTIKIIENLDFNNTEKIDACGIYPLMILMNLCKIKAWKPKLIEYKNSGDVIGDKNSVVGYSALIF